MKTIKYLAIALIATAIIAAAGCGKSSTPPAELKRVKATEAKPTESAPAPSAATPAAAAAATPAPAPAATPAPATTPAPAPAPAGGGATYKIEPNDDSNILWIGYGGIMGQMNGGFAVFSGTVTTESADLASAKIDLKIDMKSIYSNSGVLTTKLKNEDFFSTEKFPGATFVSTGITKDGAGYNVSGNLDILGAARNVTFPATMELKDGKLHAAAKFLINRNDWGIVYKGTGDNFIKDDVQVAFDILCDAKK